MLIRRSTIFCLLLPMWSVGCDLPLGTSSSPPGTPPAEITQLPRALSSIEVELLQASNAFGLDLLAEVMNKAPEGSHFFAPLSASMALGMALNGAAGQTWEEMRSALRFAEHLTEGEVNVAYLSLIDLLQRLDPAVTFELDNGLWYLQGLTPRPAFLSAIQGSFRADVQAVDFTDPGTPSAMNAWIRDRTGGRIADAVADPLREPDRLSFYILNTTYFEAEWRERFDPTDTHEGPFHLLDGTSETVQFMSQVEGLGYASHELYDAVEKPYGGNAFSMTVVVPKPGIDLETTVDALREEGWDELMNRLDREAREVRLHLPRFRLRWSGDLERPLTSLGMESAFIDCVADFTRVFEWTPPCLYLDEVGQASFVRVDERGTEAAATTWVVGRPNSGPVEVRADRPFLFAIQERLSGTILYLGVIVEPPAY